MVGIKSGAARDASNSGVMSAKVKVHWLWIEGYVCLSFRQPAVLVWVTIFIFLYVNNWYNNVIFKKITIQYVK